MRDLSKFTSVKVENNFTQLIEGTHRVTIKAVHVTNSFAKDFITGEENEDKPEWTDPTPQFALIFGNAEGSHIQRFNMEGYKRVNEIPEKKRDKVYASGEENFAVSKKDNTRVVSDKRTADADQIFSQVFEAAGLDVGSVPNDLVGKELELTIFPRKYGDKTNYRAKNFRKIGANDNAASSVGMSEESAEEADDL